MKWSRRVLLQRAIIATATLLFVGLASLNLVPSQSPFSPQDSKSIESRLIKLTSYLEPYQVSINESQVRGPQFWELPFTPHSTSACSQLTVSNWSSTCQPEIQNNKPSFFELLTALSMHFPLEWSGYGGYQLSFNSFGIKGFLYLQPGNNPKPLILFRGGIGSRADSFRAERHLLLTIAFHLGYHLLFVGSSFNDDTLSLHQFKNSGPLADVELNELIGKIFSSSEFNPWFSSIHLIGMSMSGLGAFLSSQIEGSHFKSILLMCPFISYPEKFADSKGLIRRELSKMWAKRRFEKTLVGLDEPLGGTPLENLFETLYLTQNKLLLEGRYPWVKHKPLDLNSFATNLRRILSNRSQPKVPVRVLLTVNDDIVDPKENGGLLIDQNIPGVWLQSGYHCAVSQSYPSEVMAKLLAALLDSNKSEEL